MTHASLFTGIGGFEIAAEWMGWTNVFGCEKEPFCRSVLLHHFPDMKLYNDVRKLHANEYLGRIDVLTGGFPCQPFSVGGERKGTEDDRHLWPEMLRVIRECRPRYVVAENVQGIISWDSGVVFEAVHADLENAGYSVQSFVLPACSVSAPHRRNRTFFVAHAKSERADRRSTGDEKESRRERVSERDEVQLPDESNHFLGDAPNSECVRLEHGTKSRDLREDQREVRLEGSGPSQTASSVGEGESSSDSHRAMLERGNEQGASARRTAKSERVEPLGRTKEWVDFPTTEPIFRGGDDGLPERMGEFSLSRWRKEAVKAYGNAVVPQLILRIFEAIELLEEGKY